MTTRDEIVTEARTWIGTNFRHQGRLKSVGVDCSGLIIGVARVLSLPYKDVRGYGRSPDAAMMGEILRGLFIEKPIDERLPGDILWMHIGADPKHLAIVTDIGIIHSSSALGRVVEHGLDDDLLSRVVACFSWGVD